jgi:hypothetical protein
LLRLDPRGNGPADLHYATFLGGPAGNAEWALGVRLHGDGLATLAGLTDAPGFPTHRALQPSSGGAQEAFVATVDPLPARAHRYGTSTPGCRGPASLQVNSDPAPGNAGFALLGNGAPANAPGVLALGAAHALPGWPIFNARILVAPPLVTVPIVSDPHGALRLPLPLPLGLPPGPSVFVQAVWLDPGCALGPLSASHALGI